MKHVWHFLSRVTNMSSVRWRNSIKQCDEKYANHILNHKPAKDCEQKWWLFVGMRMLCCSPILMRFFYSRYQLHISRPTFIHICSAHTWHIRHAWQKISKTWSIISYDTNDRISQFGPCRQGVCVGHNCDEWHVCVLKLTRVRQALYLLKFQQKGISKSALFWDNMFMFAKIEQPRIVGNLNACWISAKDRNTV